MPGLTPEMLAEIAAQPKEWAEIVENPRLFQKPDTLATADDAFTLLGHILWRWKVPLRLYRPDHKPTPPQEMQPEVDQIDRELASFVTTHPGILETALRENENLKLLALAQSGDDAQKRREGKIRGGLPNSLLTIFLEEASLDTGELLWRMTNALDYLSLVEFAAGVPQHCQGLLGFWARHLDKCRLNLSLLRRVGIDGFTTTRAALADKLAPSLLDAMEAIVYLPKNGVANHYFPDLLPDEAKLVTMHPNLITGCLADYMGWSPEAFSTWLVRGNFLAEGESIGEIIWRDAKTLLELGISRKVLAKALTDVMLLESDRLRRATGNPDFMVPVWADLEESEREEIRATVKQENSQYIARVRGVWDVQWDWSVGGWQGGPPLGVEVVAFAGHHHDPFHTADTYYLSPEVQNDCDCKVRNETTGEVIAYSGMAPYLIRRACFFEGSVRYRLDPAKACRVLAPLLK